MTVTVLIAGLVIACLLGAPRDASADVVELTSGQRIVGTVKEATASGVVIEVRGRELRIRQANVQAITFDGSPPGSVTKAAPVATAAPTAPLPSQRPSPPSPTALPSPLPAQIAAALAALGGLQAATVDVLAPADYAARVEEVRREVERALGDASDQPDVRAAITAAVRYHAFAAFAETVYEARGDLASIGGDPIVAECPSLTELVARDAARLQLNATDPAVVGLFAATEGASSLRACAGEKIAEAERRARATR